mgnify:CR=1 FL=1
MIADRAYLNSASGSLSDTYRLGHADGVRDLRQWANRQRCRAQGWSPQRGTVQAGVDVIIREVAQHCGGFVGGDEDLQCGEFILE